MIIDPYRFDGTVQAILTVPAGKVTEDQSNFPVRVLLTDMPAGFWTAVATNGADIRVKSGGIDLPVDIVYCNKGSQVGEIFFKANLQAAADNVFTIHAGSGGAEPAVTDPLGRRAVWSAYHRVMRGATRQGSTSTGAQLVADTTCRASGTVPTGYSLAAPFAYIDPALQRLHLQGSAQSGDYVAATLTNFTLGHLCFFDEVGYYQEHSLYEQAGTGNRAMLLTAGTDGLYLEINGGGGPSIAGGLAYDTLYLFQARRSGTTNIVRRDNTVSAGATSSSPSAGNNWIVGPRFQNAGQEIYLAYLAGSAFSDARLTAHVAAWKTPSTFYNVT